MSDVAPITDEDRARIEQLKAKYENPDAEFTDEEEEFMERMAAHPDSPINFADSDEE
jgi:hypothetical protein